MKRIQIFIVLIACLPWFAALGQTPPKDSKTPERAPAGKKAREMLMPSGQLTQDPLRVFVEAHITADMRPELVLIKDMLSLSGDSAKELPPAAAAYVITNYKWKFPDDKDGRFVAGTLLIFNMKEDLVTWYRTGMTVTPIVRWTPNAPAGGRARQSATTSDEIYLGNALGAHFWTFITLALLLAGIWIVSSNPVELMRAANGRLSLSQTQMAVWTAAIGGIVYSFGLTKLSVPDIPTSLVALMGLSAGTTAAGVLQPKEETLVVGEGKKRIKPSLKHLLTNPLKDGGDGPILLERAQMAIWTVLMLILFLYKSLLEGIIWEIPWEMVALTGISQASYIVPKQFPRKEIDPSKDESPRDKSAEPSHTRKSSAAETKPQSQSNSSSE